jgi:hypothetical protein
VAAGIAVGGLLIYASSRTELEKYLTTVAFEPSQAKSVAGFSVREVAWFAFFFLVSAAVMVVIMSGWLSGPRTKFAVVLLGLVLVADLARADRPWIVYYDYKAKYASNPVIDILREKPFEHRTAARLSPMSPNYLVTDQAQRLFSAVTEDWLQQQYQFYQVQSLDIVQMPRMPEMDAAYLAEIYSPAISTADLANADALIARLTNRTDAVSQFLWTQLTEPGRTALTRKGTETISILQDELNRILRSSPIYDSARFAAVKLSDETRALLAQNVQGRDLARLNRMVLEDAYPTELSRRSQLAAFARLWQLTNTRLVLGMKGFSGMINQQMDPSNHSFKVLAPFDFAPRESAAASGGTRLEDITTVIRPEGQFAVFEFGAALPRAKLYSHWQVQTNDAAALQRLADLAFDPQRTVVVANPITIAGTPAGSDPASTAAWELCNMPPSILCSKPKRPRPVSCS